MPRQEVLILDDDLEIRDALSALLRLEGYSVATCSSGAALLARIRYHHRPSVIVLDLSLRDMSGGQCLVAIRESSWSEVPVLVFSGWERLERFGLDANGFVAKPAEAETLVRQIDRLAGQSLRTAQTPGPVDISSPRIRGPKRQRSRRQGPR
jgi:CheY-like chemotaxis protein